MDRDGGLFRHVLSFLREGVNWVPPADESLKMRLSKEFDYYGLQCAHFTTIDFTVGDKPTLLSVPPVPKLDKLTSTTITTKFDVKPTSPDRSSRSITPTDRSDRPQTPGSDRSQTPGSDRSPKLHDRSQTLHDRSHGNNPVLSEIAPVAEQSHPLASDSDGFTLNFEIEKCPLIWAKANGPIGFEIDVENSFTLVGIKIRCKQVSPVKIFVNNTVFTISMQKLDENWIKSKDKFSFRFKADMMYL